MFSPLNVFKSRFIGAKKNILYRSNANQIFEKLFPSMLSTSAGSKQISHRWISQLDKFCRKFKAFEHENAQIHAYIPVFCMMLLLLETEPFVGRFIQNVFHTLRQYLFMFILFCLKLVLFYRWKGMPVDKIGPPKLWNMFQIAWKPHKIK